jgi:hypothetical protein
MGLIRGSLGWLLVIGIFGGVSWCFYDDASGPLDGLPAERCPSDCHYASHWGPPLDPALPFMEVSSRPFCPIHSVREVAAIRQAYR